MINRELYTFTVYISKIQTAIFSILTEQTRYTKAKDCSLVRYLYITYFHACVTYRQFIAVITQNRVISERLFHSYFT
jgi:hypothetical protein